MVRVLSSSGLSLAALSAVTTSTPSSISSWSSLAISLFLLLQLQLLYYLLRLLLLLQLPHIPLPIPSHTFFFFFTLFTFLRLAPVHLALGYILSRREMQIKSRLSIKPKSSLDNWHWKSIVFYIMLKFSWNIWIFSIIDIIALSMSCKHYSRYINNWWTFHDSKRRKWKKWKSRNLTSDFLAGQLIPLNVELYLGVSL